MKSSLVPLFVFISFCSQAQTLEAFTGIGYLKKINIRNGRQSEVYNPNIATLFGLGLHSNAKDSFLIPLGIELRLNRHSENYYTTSGEQGAKYSSSGKWSANILETRLYMLSIPIQEFKISIGLGALATLGTKDVGIRRKTDISGLDTTVHYSNHNNKPAVLGAGPVSRFGFSIPIIENWFFSPQYSIAYYFTRKIQHSLTVGVARKF